MTSTAALLDEIKKEPFETIFIIGNGVVENGWNVFKDAIEKTFNSSFDNRALLHPIAALTFTLRLFAQSGKKGEYGYRERSELLDRIRATICDSFKKSTKVKLSVTSKTDFVKKFRRGKSLILTTNWDNSLEHYYVKSGGVGVIYLHGGISDSSGIYLPTEAAIEPYRSETDNSSFLAATHRVAMEALEHAKRVVIWGCSLEAYDAELCLLLSMAHHASKQKDREYIVIDPSSTPVVRLQALLGDVSVLHVNPLSFFGRIKWRMHRLVQAWSD